MEISTQQQNDAKPDEVSRFDNCLGRIFLGTLVVFAFIAVAVAVYRQWVPEATLDARRSQPIEFTMGMCLLVMCVFALVEGRVRIVATGLMGLIVGVYMVPSVSMRPEPRLQAILSGDYAKFAPISICFGACLGTLLGQNLTPLRKILNRLNNSSPRIT